MALLRTVCPHCDIVRVKADHTVLRHLADGTQVEVDFTCPECHGRVVQRLHARMAPLLLSAGCILDPGSVADTGGITEAEIQDFVRALDRPDWTDLLAL